MTAWAYSWVGEDDVSVEALAIADLYNPEARRRFLLPLLDVLRAADIVCCHNGSRFDLPVINGECMKLGLPTLPPLMVEDTMKMPKARFKKGQDNVASALGVEAEKLPLHWAAWQAAYGEPDLATVKERCAGDVRQHKQMREAMRKAGWLKPPRMWRP